MAGPCIATEIPPEIFINICQELPPSDLLSLAQVCKKFYGFLCSTHSRPTQEIWRNSRLQFLHYVKMPPPDNMDERQYVKLLSERGCQFCKRPRIRRIYWAFRVRCCKPCLNQIRRDLLSKFSIPDDILRGLTYTTGFYKWGWDQSPKNRPANLYWKDDVYRVYNEYLKLDPDERKDWLINKRKEGRQKMEDVAQREIEHENEYWVKSSENEKKREERASTIESMIKKERNEFGLLRFKMPIVEQCMVYNKAIMSSSTHTFTNRAWIGLKNKLIPEYTKLAASHRTQRQAAEKLFSYDVAVQTRQMDILKLIFDLSRPDSDQPVFETHLIKYLPWCPTFQNLPFTDNDPRNLWDDEFLILSLIPQLRSEAIHLKNNPAPPFTVCGSFLHKRSGNKRVYRCKLCHYPEGASQLYSFYEIRLHLIRSPHKIYVIKDDMIEVVTEIFDNAENAQEFPRNKPEIFFAAGFNVNLIVNL
ncbi:39518_t:CDS:2 [Gigaspora margarita]|uniref:39518_t:CDS:1 n=1 Tax=Gigaspora margarita TaxID=4874 RepID=A0ABM8W3H4_GIGMA|nr:39518_t:CDS:2 [Gigaspora margarita]